jgi:hypothetical protein
MLQLQNLNAKCNGFGTQIYKSYILKPHIHFSKYLAFLTCLRFLLAMSPQSQQTQPNFVHQQGCNHFVYC